VVRCIPFGFGGSDSSTSALPPSQILSFWNRRMRRYSGVQTRAGEQHHRVRHGDGQQMDKVERERQSA
jgi:hypothetical protein